MFPFDFHLSSFTILLSYSSYPDWKLLNYKLLIKFRFLWFFHKFACDTKWSIDISVHDHLFSNALPLSYSDSTNRKLLNYWLVKCAVGFLSQICHFFSNALLWATSDFHNWKLLNGFFFTNLPVIGSDELIFQFIILYFLTLYCWPTAAPRIENCSIINYW